MGKKPNTIILLALIFILLVPLSARGQFRTGGRGGSGLPLGWFIASLFGGLSNVYVSPGSTSVVSGEFKPNPGNPQPPQESPQGFSPPPAYRYFPTVYHKESTGLLKLNAEPKKASIHIDDKLLAPAEQLDTGVIGLPSGSHRIRIAMPGYTSYSGKVYIIEDTTNELKVRLERE